MSHKVRPTEINLNKKTPGGEYLEIIWSDGTTCHYPLSHLREACPCVECRGGHQYMGMQHAPDDILKLTPKRSYMVESIHPVGNYAIQPFWDDGHSTGIYTWEYLYHICPSNLT